MPPPVLILGTGLAGYTLARELRKLDKQVPIVLVSRDHGGFYSKPMLSNALASGKTPSSLVMKPADKMAAELGAEVLANTAVQRIDTAAQAVTLGDWRVLGYRDLVLCLGADPMRPPLQGDAADDILCVNDLDDYARFAERLEGVASVAILGAGLIGCEFANDLMARGLAPTVIDLALRPLPRLLPEAASLWLQQRLETAGVAFRFGATVVRADRDATGLALTLGDGSRLHADRALCAIGLRPRVALAAAAGLKVAQGVAVDRLLAASAPHVHALGDCAEVEGHSLPFVMPLMQQARALAATLAGVPTPVTYPAMPVTVKTPACPTVVCPPQPGLEGRWQVELTEDACTAHFRDAQERLLGFALLGTSVSQRQALAVQTPSWLSQPCIS